MRFRVVVGYEYPVEHKPPVKAEIILHGDRVVTDNIELLEQEPTTKKDLGVDCVARQDVERYIEGFVNEYTPKEELEFINLELDGLKHIPSVTPQEPILDKIRAEIDEESAKSFGYPNWERAKALEWALGIIDKYKAETEADNGKIDCN